MDYLNQIKRTLIWVAGVTLLLSLLINYKLLGYIGELKSDNQQLGNTITSQETTNENLNKRIETLTAQQASAQQVADEMAHREREAQQRLTKQVIQLKKELENEKCSNELIAYPAGWVSDY